MVFFDGNVAGDQPVKDDDGKVIFLRDVMLQNRMMYQYETFSATDSERAIADADFKKLEDIDDMPSHPSDFLTVLLQQNQRCFDKFIDTMRREHEQMRESILPMLLHNHQEAPQPAPLLCLKDDDLAQDHVLMTRLIFFEAFVKLYPLEDIGSLDTLALWIARRSSLSSGVSRELATALCLCKDRTSLPLLEHLDFKEASLLRDYFCGNSTYNTEVRHIFLEPFFPRYYTVVLRDNRAIGCMITALCFDEESSARKKRKIEPGTVVWKKNKTRTLVEADGCRSRLALFREWYHNQTLCSKLEQELLHTETQFVEYVFVDKSKTSMKNALLQILLHYKQQNADCLSKIKLKPADETVRAKVWGSLTNSEDDDEWEWLDVGKFVQFLQTRTTQTDDKVEFKTFKGKDFDRLFEYKLAHY